MSQIDVSYGVLHYNPGANLEAREAFGKAVASLATGARLPCEVFIIDQGNSDEEKHYGQFLAETYGFNFIALKNNVGISRGINLLANMARGKYVSLVTSDVIFTPGLDVQLTDTLERNRDIWQVCPASDKSDIPYQRLSDTGDGFVCCLAQELTIQFWPREVFQKVGYFDERWKACYENLDYAVRIFLAGGYAAIDHDAFCPHDFHMSMRSGARDSSYDGYINMNGSFDQTQLSAMWNRKWPMLARYINIYEPLVGMGLESVRDIMRREYKNNLYLPYVQSVGY